MDGIGLLRTRWAAIGAAVAVVLGAGGVGLVNAAKTSGDRAVYTAIEPCRLLDTRPAKNVQRNTPLDEGEIYEVSALGDNGLCTGIPSDAVALELNVTGLLNTAATDFVIWSGAGDAPIASHVNLAVGAPPTPNSVTTELDGDSFAIRNRFGQAHVIIDVVGVYQDHNHDDRYYTESESDGALAGKADASNVYTKSESDGALAGKADASNVYTKSESDALVNDSSFTFLAAGANPTIPDIGTAFVTLASKTVDVPQAGYLHLTGSVELLLALDSVAQCDFTLDANPGGASSRIGGGSGGFETWARSLVVAVSAGSHTVNLRCQEWSGTQVDARYAVLTGFFTPNLR